MTLLHVPDIPPDADTITAALAWAAAGWYVLPVRRDMPKHAGSVVGTGWPAKSSRDPETIVSWFAGTDHAIALHLGRSGAIAWDVDEPDRVPEVLHPHLAVCPHQSTRPETPQRGHYFMALPPGRMFGNGVPATFANGWGEIRGRNGIVVAATSPHPNGGEYRTARPGPVRVMADEIAVEFTDATSPEDALSDPEVAALLARWNGNERPSLMDAWAKVLRDRIAAGESRHQSAVAAVAGAMREAAAGLIDARTVLDVHLKPAFIDAVIQPASSSKQGPARTGAQAEFEWAGIVAWAVAQGNAADAAETRRQADKRVPDNHQWMSQIPTPTVGQATTPPTPPADGATVLDRLSKDGAWLDAQEFGELEYAVDGILTEGMGLLVSPPKKGKSFWVADVGLAVASGGKALGAIPVDKRPVLYLALEDGHRRLQARFRRILAGGPIPPGMHVITKATPDEAMTVMAAFLARHAAAKPLVILDTFGKIKPPKKPNQDAYQADYAVGAALKGLVDAVPGSTLLVVHHTRKAESADFVDAVSGTHGIAGSADFILALNRKRHENTAVLAVTGRDVVEAEYALTALDGVLWRLDGDGSLAGASGAVQARRTQERLGDRSMDVLRVVEASTEVVTATSVARSLLDVDGDSAGKYLRRLADTGYIVKVGRGQYLRRVSELSEVSDSQVRSTK